MPLKNLVQVSPIISNPPGKNRRSRSWGARALRTCGHLAESYNTLQVSHRGTYSVERLQAFQCYCEQTSVTRAVVVCILTPLPALLATLLLDCIPLRSPDDGWEANYMFWIRFFVSGVVINIGLTYQVKGMVNQLEISAMKCLGIAVGCLSVYVLTLMTIASVWIFPVPFGIILGVGPCLGIYLGVLYFAIGPKTLAANPTLARELKLQLYVLGVQAILITIYPAFSALYFEVSPHYRAGLVLLLPFTKLVMKNIVAWSCSHLEEYVPVVEVFSVEVFNALYASTCMQALNSEFATVVIVGLDAVHAVLSFHNLRLETRSIHQQQSALLRGPNQNKNMPGDIVATALVTSLHLRRFRTQSGKLIRVRSPLKHSMGLHESKQLDRLATHQRTFTSLEARDFNQGHVESNTSTNESTAASLMSAKLQKKSSGRIGPSELLVKFKKQPSFDSLSREALQVELVESTLRLLFRCEYIALAEYVECAVPMLFGIYLSVLRHLPSRYYYPQTRDMVPGQLKATLTNLCMYVALELASFVLMHATVRRKVGLSALYQLAFVLETQATQLQSRLFVWIIFILQFTLQHYGVDFTFRFAWMG
ncbi:hypothetical protein PHYPSEUDO_000742 [Phytophthora pseudosyringae]|uniref:Uncharacterized protein n=1 Tax=Phytophthora pseudosyringae TaxID=221518 RepID=A0A8T1WIX7_9STRA|nr:hypothetical protein PHYPSEUDO_000742 [Phytophthora pseudosyringae]